MKPQENWDEEEVKPQEKLERREGKGGEAENSKIREQHGNKMDATRNQRINDK